MRKELSLTIAAFAICCCAAGQDSTKITTLREVVVSASRSEQPVIEIPRSVTIIHSAEIQKSVYQSLGDLLNAQSGLYVIGASQTPGTNQNIFMRGANSNQVAVLVDGVRITDASSPNSAIDLSEISLVNIERVEIIRGSHSTLFGGAAIGGVINLITKKGGKKGLHGMASVQTGIFGQKAWSSTENLSATYGAENGFFVNGALLRQDAKGLDASEKRTAMPPGLSADRDDFEKTDAVIKTGFRNASWDVSGSYKRGHQYTEIDAQAFVDDDNSYLVFDRDLFQYRLGYTLNNTVAFSALGSFSNSARFYENDSSKISATAYDKTYSSGTYYGKLRTHELQLNFTRDRLVGVFGAGVYMEKMSFDSYYLFNDPDFRFETISNYDTVDARTATAYIFTQWAYRLGKLNFSGGGRLSRHTTAGNFLTFELNPSYTLRELLLYASFSSGFNAPSLYQLYDPSKGFSAHTTLGNIALRPETSLSIEAGIKKQFLNGSYVTVSAYQTMVRNGIEYVFLWNGDTPIQELSFTDDRGATYVNAGRQTSRGIEIDGHAQASEKISFRGNVSFLRTHLRIQAGDIDEQHTGGHHVQLFNLGAFLEEGINQESLIRRPDLSASAGIAYRPIKDVSAGVSYRYTGKRFDAGYDPVLGAPYGSLARARVEAYHLLDVHASWQATKTLALAVKMENIFNEKYREVVGFETRGRSIYAKVSFGF